MLQWGHSSKLAFHPRTNQPSHCCCSVSCGRPWPLTPEFVTACPVCAQSKSSHQAPAGLLHPLPIPHCPWSHIAVDQSTTIRCQLKNTVILTMVDWFSKSVNFGSAILSSGYHLQTNGKLERANQDLESFPLVCSSSFPSFLVSSATGMSPFIVAQGFQSPLFPCQEMEVAIPSVQAYLRRV